MRKFKRSVPQKPVDPEKWQPETQTVQTVKNLIIYRFEHETKSDFIDPNPLEVKPSVKPEDDYIDDCARIGAFLMDKSAVLTQLRKLDNLLKQGVHTHDGTLKVFMLRECLETELATFGFQPHFGKTLGNVRPEVFRAAIAHGLLLKDAAIGDVEHGEFTHLIQWLVIAWQQEASHFLSKPVIELFKQLGEEGSVYYRDPISSTSDKTIRREEKSIWDVIVDAEGEGNFRAPEFLHTFILKSNELPVLREALQQRVNKRIDHFEDFKAKYQEVGSLSASRLFTRKNNKLPYRKGNAEDILEPEDCAIDLNRSINSSS